MNHEMTFYEAILEIQRLKGKEIFENKDMVLAMLSDLRPRAADDTIFIKGLYQQDLMDILSLASKQTGLEVAEAYKIAKEQLLQTKLLSEESIDTHLIDVIRSLGWQVKVTSKEENVQKQLTNQEEAVDKSKDSGTSTHIVENPVINEKNQSEQKKKKSLIGRVMMGYFVMMLALFVLPIPALYSEPLLDWLLVFSFEILSIALLGLIVNLVSKEPIVVNAFNCMLGMLVTILIFLLIFDNGIPFEEIGAALWLYIFINLCLAISSYHNLSKMVPESKKRKTPNTLAERERNYICFLSLTLVAILIWPFVWDGFSYFGYYYLISTSYFNVAAPLYCLIIMAMKNKRFWANTAYLTTGAVMMIVNGVNLFEDSYVLENTLVINSYLALAFLLPLVLVIVSVKMKYDPELKAGS